MSVMQGVHKVGDIFPLEEIYNAENQGHGKHQQFGDDFLLAGPVEDSKIQQQKISGLDSVFYFFFVFLNVTV